MLHRQIQYTKTLAVCVILAGAMLHLQTNFAAAADRGGDWYTIQPKNVAPQQNSKTKPPTLADDKDTSSQKPMPSSAIVQSELPMQSAPSANAPEWYKRNLNFFRLEGEPVAAPNEKIPQPTFNPPSLAMQPPILQNSASATERPLTQPMQMNPSAKDVYQNNALGADVPKAPSDIKKEYPNLASVPLTAPAAEKNLQNWSNQQQQLQSDQAQARDIMQQDWIQSYAVTPQPEPQPQSQIQPMPQQQLAEPVLNSAPQSTPAPSALSQMQAVQGQPRSLAAVPPTRVQNTDWLQQPLVPPVDANAAPIPSVPNATGNQNVNLNQNAPVPPAPTAAVAQTVEWPKTPVVILDQTPDANASVQSQIQSQTVQPVAQQPIAAPQPMTQYIVPTEQPVTGYSAPNAEQIQALAKRLDSLETSLGSPVPPTQQMKSDLPWLNPQMRAANNDSRISFDSLSIQPPQGAGNAIPQQLQQPSMNQQMTQNMAPPMGWTDMAAAPLVPPSSPTVIAPAPMFTPGQSMANLDPIAGAMQNYTRSMQQSAPYTSNTPYYPYGYAGFGYWYKNPNWATSQNRTQVASLYPMVSVNMQKPVATLYFRDNNAVIGGSENKIIAQVAEWYQNANPGGGLRIVGHSSSRTRDMDANQQRLNNYDLSLDRAENVAKRLQAMGIPKNKIMVQAHGDADKVFAETMPNGEAWNRRVEVYWDLF